MASKTDDPYLVLTNPRVRARGTNTAECGGLPVTTRAAFVIALRSNAFRRPLICR